MQHARCFGRDHLLRSAPLLRPLVQSAWALTVARFNTLEQARLNEFLFSAERVSLAPISSDLRQLAEGRCFYCGKPVKGSGQIDHFIPWARYIDNGLHNPANPRATMAAARAIYLRLPDGYKLWHVGKEFVVAEPAELSQILAAA